MSRAGSHKIKCGAGWENRLIADLDAKTAFQDGHTKTEVIAIQLACGQHVTPKDLAYLRSQGLETDDRAKLLKWARLRAQVTLRDDSRLNFLLKIAKASRNEQDVISQEKLIQWVMPKAPPEEDTRAEEQIHITITKFRKSDDD